MKNAHSEQPVHTADSPLLHMRFDVSFGRIQVVWYLTGCVIHFGLLVPILVLWILIPTLKTGDAYQTSVCAKSCLDKAVYFVNGGASCKRAHAVLFCGFEDVVYNMLICCLCKRHRWPRTTYKMINCMTAKALAHSRLGDRVLWYFEFVNDIWHYKYGSGLCIRTGINHSQNLHAWLQLSINL